MKKSLLIAIIAFVLGSTITGVTASIIYNAKEILYIPSDSSFKVNNVKDALDVIYNKSGTIIPSSSTLISQNGTSGTIKSITFSDSGEYKYYIIMGLYFTSNTSVGAAKCINYTYLTSITNATYEMIGEAGRKASASAGGVSSYFIFPDGSKNDITVTMENYDAYAIYGIK